MSTTQSAVRETASHSPARSASTPSTAPPDHDAVYARRARPNRPATDDEILGLDPSDGSRSAPTEAGASLVEARGFSPAKNDGREAPSALPQAVAEAESPERHPIPTDARDPENLRSAFDANPELRQAWHDAHSYRESFATPEEARAATALLADLDRMDALFFSRRPEDHAELARAVATLDPDAFASLARAMSAHASAQRVIPNPAATSADGGEGPAVAFRSETQQQIPRSARNDIVGGFGSSVEARGFSPANSEGREAPSALPKAVAEPPAQRQQASPQAQSSGPTPAQLEFFHAANAAAVRNVLDAIESQVERLLPEGVSKSARNRMVGEIYRELDSTLQSNRQLAQQMRDAFRSGALDANHQRAVVSLVTGRARQALPGVAKRVLSEWTSTVVAANHDRRSRQRAAESRVDIAGSGRAGNDGIRPTSPRDIDYARLSDSDILNM